MSQLNRFIVGFAIALGLACVLGKAIRHATPGTPKSERQATAPSSLKFSSPDDSAANARLVESYGKLPLSFELNQGQARSEVRFLTRGAGYAVLLTQGEVLLSLSSRTSRPSSQTEARRTPSLLAPPSPTSTNNRQETTTLLRMKLAGASYAAAPVGLDELPGKVNYFIGNDPKKWHSNIPTYAKVRYPNVYPGIDLVYYGHQGQLEYDFVVAPGADPGQIAIAFERSTHGRLRPPWIDEKGNVLIGSGSSVLQLNRPVIYQPKRSTTTGNSAFDRDSKPVDGRFLLTASNQIRFELGPYDKSQPLVIDPALTYSTFLGGTVANSSAGSFSVAVDSSGNTFLLGGASPPFPITPGAFETTPTPRYVAEIDPTGSTVLYATYLGATSGETGLCGEFNGGLVVDSSDNAYITGYTTSTTFPVTTGAFQTKLGNPNGCNAFVTKLNNTGSKPIYSTYLGGTNGLDIGYGITVDSSGDAYVAGAAGSTDFPTNHAIQPTYGGGQSDAFLTELNPSGTGLVFSTFLGGSGADGAGSVALDGTGAVYVEGSTSSADFPTMNPLQGTLKGSQSVFVTKFASTGSSLVYSTYLGGSGTDYGLGMAVDGLGNAYVGGQTLSPDFPTKNPFQSSCPSTACVFASKINSAGSALVYSTYLGGSGSQGQYGGVFAVDGSGNAYLTGVTWATNFPLLKPIQTTPGGNGDRFVTVLDSTGSGLVFSTNLGGSGRDRNQGGALDSTGLVYIAGTTESTDFPVLPGGLQTSFLGGSSAFLSKIDMSANANPDFLLLPAPNAVSVNAGGTAKFNVNVMPLGDFNQTVNISCTGAPSKSTCTPSPSSVTPDGTDTAAVTVSVSTTAPTQALLRPPWRSHYSMATLVMLPMGLVAFSLAGIRRRPAITFAILVLALASLTLLASCGGGASATAGGGGGAGSPGTPPGTYPLTITGASGNLSHSTIVSLTVN